MAKDRIDGVDLREALKEIAAINTFYHRDHDLGISIDQMEQAALRSDPDERQMIWVSYPYGIDCYSERQAYQRGTRDYNGVIYQGNEALRASTLTYAINITGKEDGKIMGDLFELDIRLYADQVVQKALDSNEIRLYLAAPRSVDSQLVMSKQEFDRRYPLDLPQYFYWRSEPVNTDALHALLGDAQRSRESQCSPRSMWSHTSDLHERRMAFYTNEIMQSLKDLPDPNSRDQQSFIVKLNPVIANAFGPEEFGKLLERMPYKEVAFTMRKGDHDMRVIVPRDEILHHRQTQQAKPSVRAQLSDTAARKPTVKAGIPEKTSGREL